MNITAKSRRLFTLFIFAFIPVSVTSAQVVETGQVPSIMRRTTAGDPVGAAQFLVVAYDVATGVVTKAEIRAEAVPYYDELASMPNVKSRALILNIDGSTTSQVALRRKQGGPDGTLELLTLAPSPSAAGVVFQGATEQPVFVPRKTFSPLRRFDAASEYTQGGCYAGGAPETEYTYYDDSNFYLTCIPINTDRPTDIMGKQCYYCYTCYRVLGSAWELCGRPELDCKGCVACCAGRG